MGGDLQISARNILSKEAQAQTPWEQCWLWKIPSYAKKEKYFHNAAGHTSGYGKGKSTLKDMGCRQPHIETFDITLGCKTQYSFKLRKLNTVLAEYREKIRQITCWYWQLNKHSNLFLYKKKWNVKTTPLAFAEPVENIFFSVLCNVSKALPASVLICHKGLSSAWGQPKNGSLAVCGICCHWNLSWESFRKLESEPRELIINTE